MSKFDGFAEEAQANSGPVRRHCCAVGEFLSNLPGEDAEQVERALNDRSISAPGIHAALARRVGSDAPSAYTIGVHRRRNCHCYRVTRGAELK